MILFNHWPAEALNDGAGSEYFSGNIGIRTLPRAGSALDINGTIISNGFQLTTDFGSGKVLTSDALGNATWSTATGATSIGQLSDANSNGNSLFLGSGSGVLNAGTTYSTAVGVNALATNNSGGLYNSAFGFYALQANATGNGNTATGYYSLYGNTGNYNTATGTVALYTNTAGYQNTATGYAALYSNTGNNNTAIGFEAGDNITTGSSNIVIGSIIDAPIPAGNNQLSIGNLIYGTGLNGTGLTVSTGNIGIGDSSPNAKLEVNGAIKLGTSSLCDSTTEGSQRYNSTTNGMEFCDGSGTWTTLTAAGAGDYILLADQRADGAVGGACSTTAWDTRALNTILADDTGLISISSNQATLPAGTYECEIDAEMYNTQTAQIRLYNVTDAVVMVYGKSVRSDSYVVTPANLKTKFTLSSSKIVKIQSRCQRTWDANDYGYPTSFNGSPETYMYMKCIRY